MSSRQGLRLCSRSNCFSHALSSCRKTALRFDDADDADVGPGAPSWAWRFLRVGVLWFSNRFMSAAFLALMGGDSALAVFIVVDGADADDAGSGFAPDAVPAVLLRLLLLLLLGEGWLSLCCGSTPIMAANPQATTPRNLSPSQTNPDKPQKKKKPSIQKEGSLLAPQSHQAKQGQTRERGDG